MAECLARTVDNCCVVVKAHQLCYRYLEGNQLFCISVTNTFPSLNPSLIHPDQALHTLLNLVQMCQLSKHQSVPVSASFFFMYCIHSIDPHFNKKILPKTLLLRKEAIKSGLV